MKKIPYPKTPENKDRRYKIKPSERDFIISLRKENGWTLVGIAKKYNVSINTIRNIIYPEEYEKALQRVRERNRFLRRTADIDFINKERERNRERRQYKRKIMLLKLNKFYASLQKPEFWKRGNKKRWKKIKSSPKLMKLNRKRWLKYANKNREKINKKARENYHKRNLTNK